MSKQIEFYFDVGSPTAYLAYKELQRLAKEYKAEIVYEPMLLGGVFKATKNAAPGLIPAKGKYMLLQDIPRYVKRYQVEFKMNSFFPINTLRAMRGFYAAKELGVVEEYVDATFNAMWVTSKNLGDEAVFVDVLNQAGIEGDKLNALINEDSIKDCLRDNTDKAVAKGCFGAPTMFIGDQMFFGQDRMEFVEEALQ